MPKETICLNYQNLASWVKNSTDDIITYFIISLSSSDLAKRVVKFK